MNSEILASKIISAGADIFYVDDFNITIPHSISIGGKIYYSFCDFILIPNATDLLSQEQVIVVNQIRTKYFKTHPQFKLNNIVQKKFKLMVEILEPNSILEFGPGSNPFTPENTTNKQLHYADFSTESVEVLKSLELNCNLFGKESSLKIQNDSIDIVVSIFVFHFDISQNQINELYRVLNTNGFVIANMYKRSVESRQMLLSRFILSGFLYSIIIDKDNICKDHEYWIFYKNENNVKMTTLLNHINKKKN